MTPPPITATRGGNWSLRVLWSDVTTRSPSGSNPVISRGTDPLARITALPDSS